MPTEICKFVPPPQGLKGWPPSLTFSVGPGAWGGGGYTHPPFFEYFVDFHFVIYSTVLLRPPPPPQGGVCRVNKLLFKKVHTFCGRGPVWGFRVALWHTHSLAYPSARDPKLSICQKKLPRMDAKRTPITRRSVPAMCLLTAQRRHPLGLMIENKQACVPLLFVCNRHTAWTSCTTPRTRKLGRQRGCCLLMSACRGVPPNP